MKIRKRIISTMVCICLIFTSLVTNAFAATTKSTDAKNVTVIQKDENIVKVKGEYNGEVLYGTIDRKTKEITLEADEKSKPGILSIASMSDNRNKTTKYKVKINEAIEGEKVSADIINIETKEKYLIGSKNNSKDKVKAQAVWAIPLVEILGEAVINALIAASATVVVGGVTYVVASELTNYDKYDDSEYSYFRARLAYNNVYVGEAVSNTLAEVIVRSNDPRNGIWAKNQIYAFQLAKQLGGAIYHNKHDQAEGYYYHYHTFLYKKSHIWYAS